MHEFSIVLSIIEIAEEEARKAGASSISKLVLDIGTMAGIEFYALDTAMEMAVKNTMLEKALITVNKLTAKAQCTGCGKIFPINDVLEQCPKCGCLYHKTISGKELKIKSLIVNIN